MAINGDVVLIPGFGGSQLSYKGGKGGKTALWWNPTNLLLKTPLALGLSADGETPWPGVGITLFPDGPAAFGVYEPLLTYLANHGYNPMFWSYDWRLKQSDLSTALLAWMQGRKLSNPFHVVCHSNGGLIAQLAYPSFAALNTGSRWASTIYLGTPHGGSYWAPAALAGLYTTGSELFLLGQLLDLAGPLQGASAIAGKAALLVAGQLVGSWPGLYGLLPNDQGPWAALDGRAGKAQQLSYYATTAGGQQQQWLSFATSQLAALVANLSKPRPPELSIYGLDFPTLRAFTDVAMPEKIQNYTSTTAGDGTVTQERGTLPAGVSRGFKRTRHNDLPNTLGPLQNLLVWLQTLPVGDEELPNNPGVVNGPTIGSTIPLTPVPSSPWINTFADP